MNYAELAAHPHDFVSTAIFVVTCIALGVALGSWLTFRR